MKKFILLSFLLTGLALSSNVQAQDYQSAIGLRLGYPLSISYKTFLGNNNALDLFVGYRSYSNVYSYIAVGGFYEIHNDISGVDGLQWYYGGGVSLTFLNFNDAFGLGGFIDVPGKFSVGLSGIIGLEYTFEDAPIALSLDFAPTIRIGGWDSGYHTWGALAARYILKR